MTWRLAVAALFLAYSLPGQESYGEGQLTFQGSYLGGSAQNFPDATGAGFRFNTFLPRIGLLSGSLEGYGRAVGLGVGENFLRLSGVAWGKRHWEFGGGDFSIPLAGVEYPLGNLWLPELNVLGFRVGAEGRRRRYEIFAGAATLFNGFRVPLRVRVPQRVFGASVHQKLTERWEASFRLLHFGTAPDKLMDFRRFFTPLNRRYMSVRSLTAQTHYKPLDKLQVFGEATLSAAERPPPIAGGPSQPLSMTTGLAWESERWTASASYARQSTSYLPAMGLYLGDREGPFSEISYRLLKRFSVRASASKSRNNLERNPRHPTFSSRTGSAGASLDLPAGIHLSAQFTDMDFMSDSEESGRRQTDNQQLVFTAVQTLGRNSARLSFQDLKLDQRGALVGANRLRSWEFEDSYRLGRLSFGAAARLQKSYSTQSGQAEQRDSIFFRWFGSAAFGRWGAHANIERGNDLTNQTVFAMNAFNISTAGVSARITKNWSIQADAMRSTQTTELNPQSIFVLSQGGRGPLTGAFFPTGQWSLFVRASRQLRWGTQPPSAVFDNGPIRSRVPLVGRISGYVWNGQEEKRVPVPGITISLNGEQSAITDSKGRYVFQKVAQGARRVDLHIERLPAHYNPAGSIHQFVDVRPTETSRADFHIVSLAWFEGRVRDSEQLRLENVVVRLRPGDRYTTAESDGSFSFHNLPLGEYEASIDHSQLPGNVVILSKRTVPVSLFDGSETPFVSFELGVRREKKKIRHIEIPGG